MCLHMSYVHWKQRYFRVFFFFFKVEVLYTTFKSNNPIDKSNRFLRKVFRVIFYESCISSLSFQALINAASQGDILTQPFSLKKRYGHQCWAGNHYGSQSKLHKGKCSCIRLYLKKKKTIQTYGPHEFRSIQAQIKLPNNMELK